MHKSFTEYCPESFHCEGLNTSPNLHRTISVWSSTAKLRRYTFPRIIRNKSFAYLGISRPVLKTDVDLGC